MINLVIFDCDGVLIDSEVLSFAVDVQILAGYGIEVSSDDLARRFGGVSYAGMVDSLNDEHATAIDAAQYQKECEDLLGSLFETDLRAIGGIDAVLKSLDVPVCVASGSDLARLDTCLGNTGLLDFFGVRIFSVEEVANGKPAPEYLPACGAGMRFQTGKLSCDRRQPRRDYCRRGGGDAIRRISWWRPSKSGRCRNVNAGRGRGCCR